MFFSQLSQLSPKQKINIKIIKTVVTILLAGKFAKLCCTGLVTNSRKIIIIKKSGVLNSIPLHFCFTVVSLAIPILKHHHHHHPVLMPSLNINKNSSVLKHISIWDDDKTSQDSSLLLLSVHFCFWCISTSHRNGNCHQFLLSLTFINVVAFHVTSLSKVLNTP